MMSSLNICESWSVSDSTELEMWLLKTDSMLLQYITVHSNITSLELHSHDIIYTTQTTEF
jgi:hypothetical protein